MILKRGFTLVELLVTITIFVILTGVVLFSQSRFNGTIFLTNLAYDVALTLRQAQTYGVNIKNFVTLDTNNDIKSNFVPYGVHFDINKPTSFILFADLDATTQNNKIITDGIFDGSDTHQTSVGECDSEFGCVYRNNIQRGNRINKLCVSNTGVSPEEVWGNCDAEKLDIVFTRPNPDAQITMTIDSDLSEHAFAKIILSDSAGENLREVIIQSNGLIYVKSR